MAAAGHQVRSRSRATAQERFWVEFCVFLFQQPLPVLTPLSQNLMDYSLAVSYFCSQL